MKLKKILSAILATVMLTGMMAACSGDSGSSSAAPDESGGTVSAEDASAQEEYGKDHVLR